MTGMGLNAILREIVHILGIRLPGARFTIVTPVAVTTMAKKMHRDAASRHGKPNPIVLKPIHAISSLSDPFANAIATPDTWC